MENRRKEIAISAHEIAQRVFTYSYYAGEARRSSGHPLKLVAGLQASDDDREQLLDHMNIAAAELDKIINCYFCAGNLRTENDAEHDGYTTLKFSLLPPQYFPKSRFEELQQTMGNYIVMRTLHQWILQNKPDEAAITAGEIEKLTLQMRELMNIRVKPRRIEKRNKNRIEI